MNMISLRRLLVLFSLCLGFALLVAAPDAQAQNVFVVEDSGDGGDASAGDGTCQTSGGVCTLRAAIEQANATGNSGVPDRIEFSISTTSLIRPATVLPEITDPLVIDGTTAAAGSLPRLRINGSSVGGDGFLISAGGSTVRGLHIARFSGNGITLTGAGGNAIENCQIGDYLALGSPAGFGNGGDGILITGGSTENRIGDSDEASARNIIGGNGGNGIRIDGGDPSSVNNRIYGNYIGVASDGETDLGNTGHGVLLENQTADNFLGTSQTGDLGNVISGNGGSGVRVSGTFGNAASSNTSGNSILNNRIGLNDAGDTAVPNDEHGVHVDGAIGTSVGVTGVGGSVISGNGGYGVYIFGTDVTVRGNHIGTDAAGTAAIGNGPSQAGIILVGGTSGVTIGGTLPAYRNVISGNERGIVLNSATGNVIEGNYIGVDVTGDAALGNQFEGIRLGGGSQNNTIGGTASSAGNVISGNGADGILFTGSNVTGNTAAGNHIGVNADGDADLGNGGSGVYVVDGASGNTIGGTASGARNVISGNTKDGVVLFRDATTGNVVRGNYIGTDAAGTADLGNGLAGINVNAPQTTIGGTTGGAGNVIAGNGGNPNFGSQGVGVVIDDADGTVVQGNHIGVDANGALLGNDREGIRVNRTTGLIVGGTAAGAANVIAGNGGNGVEISSNPTTSVGNAVRGNAIYANSGLGIDLDANGVTANDPGDGDEGSNRSQNFPEITKAEYNPVADQISVYYRVPSDPALTGTGASAYNLTIDFYKVDADRQEGAVYLDTGTYTDGAYNNGPETFYGFTPPSEANIDKNDFIVVTATDANGNTSEFSEAASLAGNRFVVNATGDAGDSDTSDDVCDDGSGACTLRAAIQQANATGNVSTITPDRIAFDFAGSGPYVIQPATELPRISDPLVIDGTSASGYAGSPLVVLDGQNAGGSASGANGLYVEAGGSTVRGLAVVNFARSGILLVSQGGNTVEACYIGVEADGTTAAGNSTGGSFSGLFVGSNGNTIGGATADARNVISGNASGSGVNITGDNNIVENNYIGTDAAGTAAVGNFRGVEISNASNNALRGNVISGNDSPGFIIRSDGNTLQDNRIGVNANGDPLGNGGRGVFLTAGASGNTIGGTGAGEGNVIAHNGDGGVLFNGGSSGAGTGNAVRGNAIYANTGTFNAGLGIDLGEDGSTANDPDDADGSPNNFQNFPVVQSADYDASANEVTVTYVVDTAPANATYPLAVDFYQADADSEEGAAYLGSGSYTSTDYDGCGSAPCTKTVTFTPQATVTRSDAVLATATDAAGNTSEFSAQPSALPVELAGFEAAPSGSGTVALTWQTFSETGNDRFRVERQREGDAGWATLATRKSQAPGGTSTEALRYRFEDGDLPFEASALTYRLVQRDLDGDETTVGEKTVEIGAPTAFTLHGSFPNPMRSRTTIRYELPEERRVTVAVYDALGRKVRTLVDEEQRGRQEATFEARGLASGVYFYRITAGDYTQTRKLVLVR